MATTHLMLNEEDSVLANVGRLASGPQDTIVYTVWGATENSGCRPEVSYESPCMGYCGWIFKGDHSVLLENDQK